MVESFGGDMKQEDRELLIKDLCARLPYKVKIRIDKNPIENHHYFLHTVDNLIGLVNSVYFIERIKPYLFPMSSMTEEQRDEYKRIVHNEFLDYMSVDINVFYNGNDWLNEHHFDYRGLIDKKLAIDCTNLNIY